MNNLNELYETILAGKLERAVSVTREAVTEEVAPQEITSEYMIKSMEATGARFESGQVLAPNLLTSVRAMRGAFDILKPLMRGKADSYIGRTVIGAVKGNLHDIGENLVASMLKGCGFEVINLGIDVSSDKFISAALGNKVNIICMSALPTTTMSYMKEVIDAFETSGLREKVRVMVESAPASDALVKSISADAYTSDANAAIIMTKKLIDVC